MSSTNSADPSKSLAKDIVLFDGQCKFCTKGIRSLQRLDFFNQLEFVSLHDPMVAIRFPDLTYDMLMDQMWIVGQNGKRYGGSDAVRYLTRRLPILYPFAPLLHFPGTSWFWRKAYQFVASRRYQIAGRECADGTCSIHAQRATRATTSSK